MLENMQAIILAGGISERFQTGKTKFIEKICGTEMILYPINLFKNLGIPTTLVVGFQHERIKKIVQAKAPAVSFVLQTKPLGTGHAAKISSPAWTHDHILIMNGDIPLITPELINKLYRKHIKYDADISFITAHSIDIDSTKYSRVVIDNNKLKVMEEPTTSIDDTNQCCISAGIYLAKRSFLQHHIDKITKNESTGEYYLPELIHIASENNCKIVTTQISLDIVRSIDTLADLWAVEHIRRSELLQHWMDHGVRFANTFNVLLDNDVIIEPGSYIGSGALLLGKTIIKKGCTIGAYTHIENSTIEAGSVIPTHSIITNATITSTMNLKSFSHFDGINQATKKDTIFTGAFKETFENQEIF